MNTRRYAVFFFLPFLMVGCQQRTTDTSAQNKDIVRRLTQEVWNQGNVAALEDIAAPDFVDHDTANPEPVRGVEGYKQWVRMTRAAFPDLQITHEDIFAGEGDRVVTRWTARGTHKGEFMGIAPTGKLATVTGTTIFRISGGKLQEERVQWDTLGLLRSLGVMPPAEKAAGI